LAQKVIITAAMTGGIQTPGMSPYLPITPAEIAADAVAACAAGAACVHIHARNQEDGRPTPDQAIFKDILTRIKAECNAVIGVTTGGGLGMTLEERLASVPALRPEIASCNAGSVNFVLSPAADKLIPRFDWEKPYLENTYDMVFTNTFKAIDYAVNLMYANETLPEFEVFDFGMINNIAYFLNKGIVKKPIFIQFVFGVLGGMPASVPNLVFMVQSAKQMLGDDLIWSVVGAGRHQFPLCVAALSMGGNVRVGLEDNLYTRSGVLAKSSAEQVELMRGIVERMGLEVATPDEARKILGLKGKDKVNY
jgi:uncharacterized protein (DUF849 family)